MSLTLKNLTRRLTRLNPFGSTLPPIPEENIPEENIPRVTLLPSENVIRTKDDIRKRTIFLTSLIRTRMLFDNSEVNNIVTNLGFVPSRDIALGSAFSAAQKAANYILSFARIHKIDDKKGYAIFKNAAVAAAAAAGKAAQEKATELLESNKEEIRHLKEEVDAKVKAYEAFFPTDLNLNYREKERRLFLNKRYGKTLSKKYKNQAEQKAANNAVNQRVKVFEEKKLIPIRNLTDATSAITRMDTNIKTQAAAAGAAAADADAAAATALAAAQAAEESDGSSEHEGGSKKRRKNKTYKNTRKHRR